MADTINARFSLGTKETFLQMKADQKAIFDESRTHQIRTDYYRLINQQVTRPPRPWVLEVSARAMNIVYGMIRGNSYREIEKTYREGNGPNKYEIMTVLNHYGIDHDRFVEVCGEIDYE